MNFILETKLVLMKEKLENTNRYRISFFLFKREGAYIYSGFFDTLWYIPDFKISEKIIQIIISIISKTKDKLIIQTKKEDDQILLAIKMAISLSTIRNELDERKVWVIHHFYVL